MASSFDANASAQRVVVVKPGAGAFLDAEANTQIINVAAQAITANTPVTIFTPAAGKKWRIISFMLSTTVAGAILFKEAGTERFRTPLLAANIGVASPSLGDGRLANAAAATLQLDVTVTGNVSGFVVIREE